MAQFDYIILGGGTAGCVLANRLSADPTKTVLLLEAGGAAREFWVSVPLGMMFLLGREKFDWCYKSQPEPTLNGRALSLPRGRMLGGSSSINGMVHVRGHAHDFALWEAAGADGWGWDDVLPWFCKSERHRNGADDFHGGAGEWAVGDPQVRWPALDAYLQAGVAAGIPLNPRYNDGDNTGGSYFDANIAKGRRQSTERAFLRPVLSRGNLKVVTHALIDRVTCDGLRASGVVYHQGGQIHHAAARAEVIICAGAYGSPAILERSGIGQGDRLRAMGITPVHHAAGVGENLQDHWQIRMLHKLHHTRTLNNRAGHFLGRMGLGAQYLLTGRGPMSAQPALLTLFAHSRAGLPAPDLQIHVSAASYERVGGPLEPYAGITSSSGILRPESRGSCHAVSADPLAAPAIINNFITTDADRDLAVAAIRLVRQVVGQAPMARFAPEEQVPGPQVQGDAALLDFARSVLGTTFHPTSTCAMGNGPLAVVDTRLRVRGMAGLRVVDASVMPTITSGNTAAPVVMIAERASAMIIADAKAGAAPSVAA